MSVGPLFVVFVLTHLLLLNSAEEEKHHILPCEPFPFQCGKLGEIGWPYKEKKHPDQCGLYTVDCSEGNSPKVQLKEGGHWYQISIISQANSIFINDTDLRKTFTSRGCESLEKFGLPSPSPISTVLFTPNILNIFKCNSSLRISPPTAFNSTSCGDYNLYYTLILNRRFVPDGSLDTNTYNSSILPQCSFIRLPANNTGNVHSDLFEFLLPSSFHVTEYSNLKCLKCQLRGGECLLSNSKKQFRCSKGDKGSRRLKFGLGLGLGLGVPVLFLIIFMLWRYKQRHASSKFLARSITDPYLNTDVEEGSVYCGVPVFSYTDLQKATNNFDSEKELGDGGFGTVYHGKLKDGREVAVKRLYQHNYKRVEQFKNEVEILTRLRHKNLVSLYGCTSRHSRELLLVYEYISNGTVADHLHGDRSQPSLPWSIRMSIAIETATALTYLHASEIVHRDVKTNNILLDNNFCVKVADFGLSRLFPTDVTHISTCPQGTPGYVDPEYHQCYQLTSKSDVYSFGVVLIELISSMQAVDITRHRDEINLANLATNKIQKCEFHELIDQSLGFESDSEVKRMTIAVAALAFQCLQQNKEMRPSMEEVLEALKSIEREVDRPENQDKEFDDLGVTESVQPPPSPECDELGLLKNTRSPLSPISVTQKWPSTRSVTPNDSGKMI